MKSSGFPRVATLSLFPPPPLSLSLSLLLPCSVCRMCRNSLRTIKIEVDGGRIKICLPRGEVGEGCWCDVNICIHSCLAVLVVCCLLLVVCCVSRSRHKKHGKLNLLELTTLNSARPFPPLTPPALMPFGAGLDSISVVNALINDFLKCT